MNETNGTTNGTTETVEKAKRILKPVDRTVYGTQIEAETVLKGKSAEDAKGLKVYPVSRPDGSTKYTVANGGWNAVVSVAKEDGYEAGDPLSGPPKPVTVEGTDAALAQLSESDRAALLAKYMPAPEPKKGKKGS